MTTIIRVKRRRQDAPVEAVRLECKRRRTEEEAEASSAPSFEKVLSFSGTVEDKDDLVARRTIAYHYTRSKRQNPKLHDPKIADKIRKEAKQRSDENRFKVISCLRKTSGGEHPDAEKDEIAIVDVNLEKGTESPSDDLYGIDDACVYDLYYANFGNDEFSNIYLDNVVGIKPYSSQSVFDMQYRDPEDGSDEDFNPDEDDSNDENNWRNSYPDDDGSGSDEFDELATKFGHVGREGSYDLSSDEGEEKYLNYYDKNDKSEYYYHEAENLGGSRYARYKVTVMKHLESEDGFVDVEELEEDEKEEQY